MQPFVQVLAALLLANKTQSKTGSTGSKGPDKGIHGGAEARNAVNANSAGEVGADGRHERDNGGAGDDDAAAEGVAPKVPPDRLAKAGVDGVELADLVVLLALARGDVGGKDELAGGEAEKGGDGQQGEEGGRVGGLDGGDALEVEDEDLGEDEAEGEGDDRGVDAGGQGADEQLERRRDEVLVVQLGAGEAQAAERPREVEGSRRRGHVEQHRGDGGAGADAVEHGDEPNGRGVRDKGDEADVDKVEVGEPGNGNLGGAPAGQQRELGRALGAGAQDGHLVAAELGNGVGARGQEREGDELDGGEPGGCGQAGEGRPGRGALDGPVAGRGHAGLALPALLGPGGGGRRGGRSRGRRGGVLLGRLARGGALGGALGRGASAGLCRRLLLGGALGGRVLFGGSLCGRALGRGGLCGRGGRVGRRRAGLALDGFSRHCGCFLNEKGICAEKERVGCWVWCAFGIS